MKKDSLLVTLDFSRAFDTLNFEVVLSALQSSYFSPLTLQWFKSYLTGRQQLTANAGERFNPQDISTSVPQGSLLGPLLFNLYINSLLNLLPRDCAVTYVDDITLVCSGDVKAIMTQMQFLLDSVFAWVGLHKLRLNVSKCYAMFMSSAACTNIADQILPSLLINNDSISWTEQQVKTLGVTFNSLLSWSTHSNNVCMKISRMIGMLQ